MYLFHRKDWGSEPTEDDPSWIHAMDIGGGSGGTTGGARGGDDESGSGGQGNTGISSSALRGGSTLRGYPGVKVTTSGALGYGRRGTIWSQSSPFGRNSRPSYPYFLVFGFWPIYWISDYPDGATPTDNTRPGGPLISAAFTFDTTPTTYILYGDTQSVQELIPKIIEGCDAVKRTAGYNASANSTMELYREDSFALLGVGVGRNASFEMCVNNTIGYNLPVVDSGGFAVRPGVWSVLVVVFAM